MSEGRRKTLLRTIRITKELNDLLQRDAGAKGVSVNALISSIMTKYSEWDRYTERFGYASLTREGFRLIVEAVNEQKLAKVAQEFGTRFPKEFIAFWFKRVNVQTYLAMISLYSKYSGLFAQEVEADGGEYVMTIHHDFGEKWSTWVRHVVGEGLKVVLGIAPQVEVTKNSVVFRFRSP